MENQNISSKTSNKSAAPFTSRPEASHHHWLCFSHREVSLAGLCGIFSIPFLRSLAALAGADAIFTSHGDVYDMYEMYGDFLIGSFFAYLPMHLGTHLKCIKREPS